MRRLIRRRRTTFLALGAVIAGLLLCAPGAFAATLSVDGSGNAVYTPADGHHNGVEFDQSGSNVVVVHELTSSTYFTNDGAFSDDDPITPDGTSCTAGANDADGNLTFTCTGVSGSVIATGGDLADDLDAGGQSTGDSGLTTIPANLDGGADSDQVVGGRASDLLHGGSGADFVSGEAPGGAGSADQVYGDDGSDFVAGGPGNDLVDAGAGDDQGAVGGPGNDTINGGDGNDGFLAGGPGNDTINGGAGDDQLVGDCGGINACGNGSAVIPDGNDTLNGGGGNDTLSPDGGTDVVSGGTGLDQVQYADEACDLSGCHAVAVSVTPDDVANDGGPGEGDNVASDVEDASVLDRCGPSGCGSPAADDQPGGATLTGNAGINALSGASGPDTITGGAGNDFLFGNGGNDTINAVDGFADRVDCGAGTDVANVDQFDQVSDNCETVNVTQVGNANEDHPPTVAWIAPADDAVLSTKAPNTLQVTATDDKGVTQVVFMVGERVLCVVKTAPYTCSYSPQDVDLGRDTLTAIAYDANQQTASAVRNVKVPQFQPGITAKTSPKRDRNSPFRFTTTGKLTLPANTTPQNSCAGGQVSVQFKAGKKTVSTRRANLRKDCTFSSRVTFTLPKRLHPRTLRVFVTFRGNEVLAPVKFRTYTVRVK